MRIEHKTSILSRLIASVFSVRYFFTRESLLKRELNRTKQPSYTPSKPFISQKIGNLDVYSLEQKDSSKHLVFFHGGAYVLPGNALHVNWLEEFHTKADVNCHMIDYPLAPEYTVDITVKQVVLTMQTLMKSYDIKELYLVGDSAGGGLILALLEYLEKELIQGIYLITPWLNMEVDTSFKQYRSIIDTTSLLRCAVLYTDNQLDHPSATVIKKDVSGLPTVVVYSGDYDPLYQDAVDFVLCNPSTDHHVYHKGIHDFALIPYTKEFKNVMNQIIDSILNTST